MQAPNPDITVIPGDMDGAQLRRYQLRKHARARGKQDQDVVNDAIFSKKTWVIAEHHWQRIFGGDR